MEICHKYFDIILAIEFKSGVDVEGAEKVEAITEKSSVTDFLDAGKFILIEISAHIGL